MKKLLLITLMLAFGLTGFTQPKNYLSVNSDNHWNNAANWSPEGVPTANDDVFIGHWVGNTPLIIHPGTNAVAKSILLDNTSPGPWPFTVQGNLDVSEDITISKGADFIVSVGGTVTYLGDVHVNDNSTLHVNGIMKYVPPPLIIVTSNADSGPNTLRQAIADVADGGDITFKLLATNEQITLLSPLTINKSLTIDGDNLLGSGVDVEVWQDGDGIRIFHITTAAGGKTIEFKNMEINEGVGTAPGGGAILCEAGTLNVDNVVFFGNEAEGTGATDGGGAIHAISTTCNISNSTFDGNYSAKDGGGMYVSDGSNCNITNSTFGTNTSDNDGGGMLVKGSDVTITGCTFSDNEAGAAGGGIKGVDDSGLIIINSTFSGNQANGGDGGAISASGGTLNMNFTTVSGNTATTYGGGIDLFAASLLTIQNCMLGNNTAATGSDFSKDGDCAVTDDGYNIVEDSDGFTWSATGDIYGQQANLFGTGLTTQTLADNGGPTQTLAIEPLSVAIEAGVADATVTTDQRGTSRLDPPTIGAFEHVVPTVTNTETGETWMDRNLGATQVATSSTDADAYGDLYQWGRLADGHASRTSGTTTTLSSTDVPGHDDFITPTASPYDWRAPQNDNLWQGEGGINNPCPNGFRLPTEDEWIAELTTWTPQNAEGAYLSPLHLTVGGYRDDGTGGLTSVGAIGFYWSSSFDSTLAKNLRIAGSGGGQTHTTSDRRAFGFSVRCIKE